MNTAAPGERARMLPYVTADLPGLGGRLRTEPEDFVVHELPAYEPCGEGEHRYLELTKRDETTPYVTGELARALGIHPSDVAYAGMKDRRAVTTQRFSIPALVDPTPLLDLPYDVRDLGLHTNKLRRGHQAGNRFQIRVRGAHPDWQPRAAAILEALQARGWANFYGPQRFGRDGQNARAGESGVRTGRLFGPVWRRWLMVSAFQSELFNKYLERRLADGLFGTVLDGDVCGRLPRGGVFLSTDREADQPRVDGFEISPMGPIFGHKMMAAAGEARAREEALLAEVGVALPDFKRVKAEGSRRRFRLPVGDMAVSEVEGDPVFSFELPSGSYATVLLDEFMKVGPHPTEAEEPDED